MGKIDSTNLAFGSSPGMLACGVGSWKQVFGCLKFSDPMWLRVLFIPYPKFRKPAGSALVSMF